jgi:hypothetical protein
MFVAASRGLAEWAEDLRGLHDQDGSIHCTVSRLPLPGVAAQSLIVTRGLSSATRACAVSEITPPLP